MSEVPADGQPNAGCVAHGLPWREDVLCHECMDCPDLVPYGQCDACGNAASKTVPRRDRIYVAGKHGHPGKFVRMGAK